MGRVGHCVTPATAGINTEWNAERMPAKHEEFWRHRGVVMKIQQIHPLRASLVAMAIGGAILAETVHCQTGKAPATDPATSGKAAAAPVASTADSSYVIGDNDLLAINVWNEPDLKQSIPVRPDGKISLPLIGDVQAAGRTPSQLQEDITSKLHTYITHPDVTVIVQQINSKKFNILGRVMKPGAYPLSSTTTVLDAIAQAGGFQDFAKEKDIYVLRENPGGDPSRFRFNYKDVVKGRNREQNIKLEPNDTIIVP